MNKNAYIWIITPCLIWINMPHTWISSVTHMCTAALTHFLSSFSSSMPHTHQKKNAVCLIWKRIISHMNWQCHTYMCYSANTGAQRFLVEHAAQKQNETHHVSGWFMWMSHVTHICTSAPTTQSRSSSSSSTLRTKNTAWTIQSRSRPSNSWSRHSLIRPSKPTSRPRRFWRDG